MSRPSLSGDKFKYDDIKHRRHFEYHYHLNFDIPEN